MMRYSFISLLVISESSNNWLNFTRVKLILIIVTCLFLIHGELNDYTLTFIIGDWGNRIIKQTCPNCLMTYPHQMSDILLAFIPV